MHMIVIGAGPLGDSLVELAVDAGHDVALVEEDEACAEAAASKHDVLVLHGSVAESGILEEARVDAAAALIATTTDDSTNLMAMVLGQEYEVGTLISVVNHKHHQGMFDRLGVLVLVDPEILIARHLFDLVLHPTAEDVTTLRDGEQIFEVTLQSDSPLVGQPLSALREDGTLPADASIVSVERGDEQFFPRADTALEPGDELIVFSRNSLSDKEMAKFAGTKE